MKIISLILILIGLVALGGCVVLVYKIDRGLRDTLKNIENLRDGLQSFRRRIEANGDADNNHK
jgi:hypothetical protein